jgi:hypothetical protein
MVLPHSLFGRQITVHIALVMIGSTHALFLNDSYSMRK